MLIPVVTQQHIATTFIKPTKIKYTSKLRNGRSYNRDIIKYKKKIKKNRNERKINNNK